MLKLENVSASYGSVPAISNVSIEIGDGEAVGLLGANGAGKSTTLRAISGLVKLTSGTITFAGNTVVRGGGIDPRKIACERHFRLGTRQLQRYPWQFAVLYQQV